MQLTLHRGDGHRHVVAEAFQHHVPVGVGIVVGRVLVTCAHWRGAALREEEDTAALVAGAEEFGEAVGSGLQLRRVCDRDGVAPATGGGIADHAGSLRIRVVTIVGPHHHTPAVRIGEEIGRVGAHVVEVRGVDGVEGKLTAVPGVIAGGEVSTLEEVGDVLNAAIDVVGKTNHPIQGLDALGAVKHQDAAEIIDVATVVGVEPGYEVAGAGAGAGPQNIKAHRVANVDRLGHGLQLLPGRGRGVVAGSRQHILVVEEHARQTTGGGQRQGVEFTGPVLVAHFTIIEKAQVKAGLGHEFVDGPDQAQAGELEGLLAVGHDDVRRGGAGNGCGHQLGAVVPGLHLVDDADVGVLRLEARDQVQHQHLARGVPPVHEADFGDIVLGLHGRQGQQQRRQKQDVQYQTLAHQNPPVNSSERTADGHWPVWPRRLCKQARPRK